MRALRATYFHNCDKGSAPNTAIATGTVTGKSHQCDWGNSSWTLTLACITPLSPTFTCVTSFQTWGDRLNSHRRAKRHTIISGFIEKCGERERDTNYPSASPLSVLHFACYHWKSNNCISLRPLWTAARSKRCSVWPCWFLSVCWILTKPPAEGRRGWVLFFLLHGLTLC